MARVAGNGEFYIHQDANWNVVGVTDLGGNVVERNVLTPYGQLTVDQKTAPGDYDGDGDVDSTDRAAGESGGTCRGSSPTDACRILDLDFDDDVDDDDLTLFDALPQRNMDHPGLAATAIDQPLTHQGLLYDPEIGSYQNRARQYDPERRSFAQRDPSRYREAMNLYVYLKSSPTRLVDPTGRDCCSTMASDPDTPANWKGFRCCDCDLAGPTPPCILRLCINSSWAGAMVKCR